MLPRMLNPKTLNHCGEFSNESNSADCLNSLWAIGTCVCGLGPGKLTGVSRYETLFYDPTYRTALARWPLPLGWCWSC